MSQDTPTMAEDGDSAPARRRWTKKRKALWFLGALLLLFVVALVPGMFDSGPVDASDFAPPEWPTVSADLNLLTEIEQIRELSTEPDDFFFHFQDTSDENGEVEELHRTVAANAEYLEALKQLLERPHCRVVDPVPAEGTRDATMALGAARHWIELARDSLILRGESQAAADLALDWFRVTRDYLENSPSVFDLLLALALYQGALNGLAICACTNDLDTPTLEKFAAVAAQPVDLSDAFQRTLPFEYLYIDQILDEEMRKSGASDLVTELVLAFTYKPNRTRGLFLNVLRATRAATASRDAAPLKEVLREFDEVHPLRRYLGGNLAGRRGTQGAARAYLDLYEGLPEKRAALRMPQICIALRRFEIAHGQLPSTLEELVPEYLPPDAFDARHPILYEPEVRWIGLYPRDADDLDVYPHLPAPLIQWKRHPHG